MNISHFEFSVVVVANDHNPSILNPDFLERQGIVQEGWGWTVMGSAITTPPFATVSYDSGVTVSVESNRLQVTDTSAAVPLRPVKSLTLHTSTSRFYPTFATTLRYRVIR